MMMSNSGIDSLYFFDQPFRTRTRRPKVASDILPFQLKESRFGSKGSGTRLKNRDQGLESLTELPVESEEVVNKDTEVKDEKDTQKILTDEEQKQKGDRQRHSHPEVKTIGGITRDDLDDDEDIQKFLFEETKFSAPSILSQLSKLIERIIEEKFVEEKEAKELYKELESTYGENLEDRYYNSESFCIVLPVDLQRKLNRTYEQLILDTVYTKRLWQNSSYRDWAGSERLPPPDDSAVVSNITNITYTEDKRGHSMGRDKDELHPVHERHRRVEASDSLASHATLQGKESRDSGRASDFEPPTIIAYRGERKTTLANSNRPRTRAEKYKFYHVKERQEQGKVSAKLQIQRPSAPAEAEEEEVSSKEHKQREFYVPPLYGPTTVINFTMTNRQCLENGWVKMQSQDEDPERQTLIEWARGRLLLSIKKKEEQDEVAKKLQEDGPLVVKYYGDTKRDVTIKYKKGVSLARRLAQMGDDRKLRFLTILPDGSGYCSYSSGRIAVTRSKKGAGIPGIYTFVHSDNHPSQLLACFLPSGRACCYYKSGNIRFVNTEKCASFHEEDGTVTKKWKWSSGKMQTTAVIQLNEVVTLKCVNITNMTLFVKSGGETTKFPVGALSECLGLEQESMSIPGKSSKSSRDDKKTRFKKEKVQVLKMEVSDTVMEERAKELGEKFPERKGVEFDSQDSRDLYKLKHRVKNLVNEWLEHYRVVTGITTNLRTGAFARRRDVAHSASSLPTQLPSSPRKQQGDFDRAPSAPPMPKTISYRSIDANNQQRPHSSSDVYGHNRPGKKGEKRIVRIDAPSSPRAYSVYEETDLIQEIPSTRAFGPPVSPGPFRCGIPQQKQRTAILPKEGCPIALRMEMLGHSAPQCRCDKRCIPYVSDLEYELFVQKHLPKTQLLVVLVASSKNNKVDASEQMLDGLYYDRNKGRSFPCVQSRYDPFRLVRYDVDTACPEGHIPILQRRHNVVPGMCLMYTAGKLIFADFIFNGYGNARKDFLKQVSRSRKDSLQGISLPMDFKFDPRPSRSGNRTAWGGEIGTPVLLTQENSGRVGSFILTKDDRGDTLRSFDRYQSEPTSVDFVRAGLSPNPIYRPHQISLSPKS